jgi:hypothetical protein
MLTKYINNVFKEGELDKIKYVVQNFHILQQTVKRIRLFIAILNGIVRKIVR